MNKDIRVTELIKKIESREIDPNAAAAEILEKFWAAYKN
jgi:hypothetical protein